MTMKLKEPILLKRVGKIDPVSVSEYTANGGYEALKKAVKTSPSDIITEVETANLRGRGGAAYPAGRKWRQLFEMEATPKYITCNADEGEPGTFKDKVLLEKDPLSVIEGMTIAGYVFGSNDGYIYIRGEYQDNIQKTFQKAIDNAVAAGMLGKNILGVEGFDYNIHIVSGGGAYVCGENSSLLNSIEGKAGRPRIKPPHLAEVGLYGKPTLVNNVETYACIPQIVTMGGQAFLELGTPEGGGTKLVCLSGHIKNPGVYEIALGTSMKDLLYSDEYGGGSSTGKEIKFCHFGGQSGPIGYKSEFETAEYSYEGLWNIGLAVGSGAVVVLDESVSVVDYLTEVMAFFVHESCGKCTPCRLGTTRAHELLNDFRKERAKDGDLERLTGMLTHITNLSSCGLGQSVGIAYQSALKNGENEFRAAVK